MKLTFIFVLLGLMSFASVTYSQATKLTFESKNATIESVFKQIEALSEFKFAYNSTKLDVDKIISLKVENQSIDAILDKILKSADFQYKIVDRYIIITDESSSNSGSFVNEQAAKKVTGKVTDSSGASLPGVSVVVKGTTNGSITDANGNYSISNVPESATLQFSFVGMKTQEINVSGKTSINVRLAEESIGIEEVVAIGYGTQKKVNLTGSIDVVSQEALSDRPSANVGQLLQGLSPNLNIAVTGSGGMPGASMNFNIRGTGTLSGSNAPLILVDGVETNIDNIDPETIESTSILKDAASAAIYGSRAPFGVVLITTKKGEKNKAVKISYNNNIAFSSPTNMPKWQSSIRYVTAYNQALRNSGQPDKFLPEQIDRINRYLAGTYTPEYDTINPPNYTWGPRHEGNANYDYFDLLYKDVTVNQKHNVNISGGDEKNQFYISTGYYDQGGSFNWVNEYYKRYNVLANFTSQATPWLRLNLNTKYSNIQSHHPNYFGSTNGAYFISELTGEYPITSLYNVNGSINNPLILGLRDGGYAKGDASDLLISMGTEIEPIKRWKTNFNYSYNNTASVNKVLNAGVWVELPTGDIANEANDPNSFEQSWDSNKYRIFSATTSYEKSYKGHFLKGMIGYEGEYRYNANIYGYRYSLITEDVPSFSTANGEFGLDDGMGHSSTEAVFGRLNYNYNEKYLLEINARYNGSSRFAKDSRWGFFPSVSAGYNIAKEEFWEPFLHSVNNLKLRASYGSLGNQNVPNYLYLSNIPMQTNLEWIIDGKRPIYSTIPAIKSPTLTWETVNMLDLGLDANLFNSRLGLVFDWYKRNTSDMFGPAQILPARLGTSAPQENNASLTSKGWELSLEWKDRINNDLHYSARLTIADNRTHVTKYLNTQGLIDNWYVGKEVGEIWGYQTVGLIQTQEEADNMPDQSYFYNRWGPGDVRYADLNGDEKINDGKRTLDDHGDLSIIGNTSPRYTVGFTGTVTWKNFDFSMFWYGILKRNLPTASVWGNQQWWGVGTRGDSGGSFYQGMDNYWRPADETNMLGPNTDAFFPKPYVSSETYKNQKLQSRYILNTAFVALKNIQLGYTIPNRLTQKIKVEAIKIYISGENLARFDKVPPYVNPEEANSNSGSLGAIYPLSRSISMGLNVTF